MDALTEGEGRLAPPDAEIRRRCASLGITVLERGGSEWPDRLEHLSQPPEALYLCGDPAVLHGGGVAIVGSRRSTRYGRGVAGDLATRAALGGETVWSGLAYGIDAAAHEGAVEAGAVARCAAVLGAGPDIAAPRGNARLHRRLREGGVLLSEYPPGMKARPWHFPARNRLIAALADEIVVVEAADRSGALITARIGLELGREVWSVPGPIDARSSIGTNRLLADGAAPVLSVKEWWESRRQFEFRLEVPRGAASATGRGSPDALLDALASGDGPTTPSALAARLDRPLETLLSRLLELEITGQVERTPGGGYRRLA